MSLLLALVGGGASSQNIAPPLFVNQNTFAAATVTSTVNLAPSLFTNVSTFYIPTVSASYAINVPLFVNSSTFYAPSVTSSYAISVPLAANTNVFYSPTVSGVVNLLPSLFVNTNLFYSPTVTQNGATQNLTVGLIVNTNQFPQHEVSQPKTSGGAGNYFKPARPKKNKIAERADKQLDALAKLKAELEQKEIESRTADANKSDLAYQAIRKAQNSAKAASEDYTQVIADAAMEYARLVNAENARVAEIEAQKLAIEAAQYAEYLENQAQIQKIAQDDEDFLQILAFMT